MNQGVHLRGKVKQKPKRKQVWKCVSHEDETRSRTIYSWAGGSSSKGEWTPELVLCACTQMTWE